MTTMATRRSRKTGGVSIALLVVAMAIAMSLQLQGSEGFHSVSPPAASKSCRGRTCTTTITTTKAAPLISSISPIASSSSATTTKMTTTALNALAATDLLSNSDVWVFLAGIFPFAWATYEFWRRIMFGESFGTGSDRVIIGMEDSPSDSRGARVLGRGALVTAYAIFVCAFATLAVVGYSVATSEAPSQEALAAVNAATAAAASATTGGGPPAL